MQNYSVYIQSKNLYKLDVHFVIFSATECKIDYDDCFLLLKIDCFSNLKEQLFTSHLCLFLLGACKTRRLWRSP